MNLPTFITEPACRQQSFYSAQRDAAKVSMGQRVSLADERDCTAAFQDYILAVSSAVTSCAGGIATASRCARAIQKAIQASQRYGAACSMVLLGE